MKNYAVAFGSLAICLAPNVVKADENLSVYAGIYGGLSLLTDNTVQIIDFVGGPVGQTFYLNYDAGVAAGGLVGVRLSENVRVGVELAYRSGALGELTSPGNIITDGYAFDTTAIALLGAVFVDLPVGASFTPYFGVGFGAARLTTSGSLAPGDSGFDYGSVTQSGPAAIVHLGAAIPLTETLSLFADYSYLHVFGADDVISTAGYADKLGKDFGSHAVSVGIMAAF